MAKRWPALLVVYHVYRRCFMSIESVNIVLKEALTSLVIHQSLSCLIMSIFFVSQLYPELTCRVVQRHRLINGLQFFIVKHPKIFYALMSLTACFVLKMIFTYACKLKCSNLTAIHLNFWGGVFKAQNRPHRKID